MSARDEIAVQVLNGNEKSDGVRTTPPPPKPSPPSEVFIHLNVALFAIFGCLIRVGTDMLFGSKHFNIENSLTPVTVSFFSNMIGSFILGLLTGSALKKVPGMSPVYTGISTGLCGSITTYSKWNQQISALLVGSTNSIGQDQVTALVCIALGLSTSICSFHVGKDLSSGIRDKRREGRNGRASARRTKSDVAKCFNVMVPILLIGCWVALLVLAIVYVSQQTIYFTCLCGVFAPFGALCRYRLGKINSNPPNCMSSNSILRSFPLGTFLANFIGSILIALCSVVTTWAVMPCYGIGIVKAIGSGFLACLTTVSTFMSEISTLRGKGEILAAHSYTFATFFLCQSVGALINGASYGALLNDPPPPSNITCS